MKRLPKCRMKISDYFRLGALSIAARKKSTKNTVFGMAFGLILLVPMIFFALAFYTDLSSQVNSIRMASQVSFPLKNINDSSTCTPFSSRNADGNWQEGISAFMYYDDLIAMEGADEYILSEYSRLSTFEYGEYGKEEDGFNGLTLRVNDIDYEMSAYSGVSVWDNYRYGYGNIRIIYTEESTSNMFTNAELEDYYSMTNRRDPFLNICNYGFDQETKGKGEVIISDVLLKDWGIDTNEIANKDISILYPAVKLGDNLGHFRIDNDTNPNNVIPWPDSEDDEYQMYLMYEFRVVGIIRGDYYELPGKNEEAHIWVTASSVYYPQGRQEYKPIGYKITQKQDYGQVLTFEQDIDTVLNLNTNQQYMLFLQSYADRYVQNYTRDDVTYSLNQMKLNVQLEDYNYLATYIPNSKHLLRSAYSEMSMMDYSSTITNEVYSQFMMIDQIGSIFIIVFTAIGGIIFFTNMLNLLNTLRYSVESRKNYIGVMRAIGAKSKIIPKLYIFEILIILFKVFLRVAIFSTLLSYGIKYLMDMGFDYIPALSDMKVNFMYYPIALGGALAVTLIISVFFARISSKFTAYQPILKTLYDEK